MSIAEHETANVAAVAVEELVSVIERIERLELKKTAIAADIRDIYVEAKGTGFDVKASRDYQNPQNRRPQARRTRNHARGVQTGSAWTRTWTSVKRPDRPPLTVIARPLSAIE